MQHGPVALPTMGYFKPHQVQQYLDKTCSLTFIAVWKKNGKHRQLLTDRNTNHENIGGIDYDYQVGQKVLVWNDGIFYKAESKYLREP